MINQQITKCHSCTAVNAEFCNDDPRMCGRGTKEETKEESKNEPN